MGIERLEKRLKETKHKLQNPHAKGGRGKKPTKGAVKPKSDILAKNKKEMGPNEPKRPPT